jgi:alcohol dehydrogenase class IV
MSRFDIESFQHEFNPGRIDFGNGCVSGLSEVLDENGWGSALVFCGSNVRSNPDVMTPIKEGLGDHLVDVFDGSSPAKHVGTVYECLDLVESENIDVLVGVGGGSTLDMARAVRLLEATDRSREALQEEIRTTGSVSVPDGSVLPGVVIPTTLAGADLSVVGGARGILEYPGQPEPESEGGFVAIDERLMPDVLLYDPELFATTPDGVLASSAMNGFNKAIEMLYSPHADPITDSTAAKGLRLLGENLSGLVPDPDPDGALKQVITGIILSQYGLSVPEAQKISIVHGFGHGFSTRYEVQQGTVHGIVAPAVLEYVFDQTDGRRHVIAESLGITTEGKSTEAVAEAIVSKVTSIRNELGLPSQLRSIEGLEKSHLPPIAEEIETDPWLEENSPSGLDRSKDTIEEILNDIW